MVDATLSDAKIYQDGILLSEICSSYQLSRILNTEATHPIHIGRYLYTEAMNYFKAYGLEEHAKKTYKSIRNRESGADDGGKCIECRECEEKCPQKIEIVKQLKETDAALAEAGKD